MINWSNVDKLASWKKLMSLKGMVSVADESSACVSDVFSTSFSMFVSSS